jgi:hypothetical protein
MNREGSRTLEREGGVRSRAGAGMRFEGSSKGDSNITLACRA